MTEPRPRPSRGIVIVTALVALLVAAGIVAAVAVSGEDTPPPPATSGPVERPCPPHAGPRGFAVAGTAEVGAAAPAFTGETVDGCVVSSADFAGRPLVIAFGASWCEPCRREWPELIAERSARDESFDVVTVSFDDLPSDAQRFLDEVAAPWQTVADPDGRLAAAFRVSTVPTTFYVDATGVIRTRVFGGDPADISDALDRITSGPAGS